MLRLFISDTTELRVPRKYEERLYYTELYEVCRTGRFNYRCDLFSHFIIPVTCKAPPHIEHARHNGDSQSLYPSGQQLMYTCAYGYYADGNSRAMCSGEGKWIGLTLLCSRKIVFDKHILRSESF